MHRPKEAWGRTVRSPGIEQLSVQVVLEQLVERPGERPQKVVGAHADRVRLPDVWPHVEKLSVLVEDLNAVVRSIGDVDAAVAIGRDRVRC